MPNETQDKVIEIIVDVVQPHAYAQINLQDKLIDDLGADSFDTVELQMNLEAEFEIEISDDEAEKMGTVQDIINLVAAKTTTP